MRRALLSGSLLALLAVLCALWAYRYERSPGFPIWRLADLRALAPPVPGVEWTGAPDHPQLCLRVDSDHPRVAARFAIPGIPAVGMLHLRFRMSARGLTPGGEKWEDGRFMVEWHAPSGDAGWENDPVGSIRYDQRNDLDAFVIQALRAPAVPALRLEHLGRSGEFELADLEITVVEERASWKIGRWLLAIGWLAWGTAWVRSWPGIGWWRALGAAAIGLLLGIYFVIPGPWKIQRPIYPSFQLGEERAGRSSPDQAPMASAPGNTPLVIASGSLPALGKIPVQGSLALRIKYFMTQARPLLHVLLLFAPSLALAWLVGRRPALFIGVTLALAIELAQVAFGYGFDWVDVFDLACDAGGIALAMWVHKKMLKPKKLKS
jgi:hypothetical protein